MPTSENFQSLAPQIIACFDAPDGDGDGACVQVVRDPERGAWVVRRDGTRLDAAVSAALDRAGAAIVPHAALGEAR